MIDFKQKRRKEKLREEIREIRNEMYDKDAENCIIENFLDSDIYKNTKKFMVYSSMEDEIDTAEIIRRGIEDQKEVYLPKIDGERILPVRIENYPEDLEIGTFNILEPGLNCKPIGYNHELDLVVVPGLAFSPDGSRLGRGGGYYDRFLPTTVCKKVALAPESCVVEDIPTENFDQPVDLIITEDRTIIAARPPKLEEKALFYMKLD